MSTMPQDAVKSRLFRTMLLSRETSENGLPAESAAARQAKSARPPAVNALTMARIKTPRAGSEANECTEVKTPERTRKVPSRLKLKVRMASRTVHAFRLSRFSIAMAECKSAVPVSQGISDAFSTGSQNHQPPQPSV